MGELAIPWNFLVTDSARPAPVIASQPTSKNQNMSS